MVDQSFDTILESVAARHQDKGWRTVLGRASSGVMSAIGMRRGPRIAESVERTAAARAAYEEALEAEDLATFDEPEPARAAEPARASARRPEGPSEPRKTSDDKASAGAARAPHSSSSARPAEPAAAGNGSAREVGAAYAKAVQDGPQPGAPSTHPYDVAMELNLLALRSVKDLLEARRTFARANHPDRVALAFRNEATTRMQIANRLVDDAVARMSGQGRR